MNFTYEGQSWLIKLMLTLGYKFLDQSNPGLCHGIANLGMKSFLSSDINSFVELIHHLFELNKTNTLRNTDINKLSIKDKLQINEDNSLKLSEACSFCDGVALYQEPESHSDFFEKGVSLWQSHHPARKLYFPGLKQKPVSVYEHPWAFDIEELTSFLNSWEKCFSIPISFILGSFDHSINLNFNPQNKNWLLIDANELPVIVLDFKNRRLMANEIINAFMAGEEGPDNAVFNAEAFVSELNENKFKESFCSLRKERVWNQLMNGNTKKIKTFDLNSFSLLSIAAQYGHLKVVESLIANGVEVNQKCNEGQTPLYFAAENGHVEVIKRLLANGANVDRARNGGVTPLLIAAENGHVEALETLLANGAAINRPNNKGETPLFIAIKKEQLQVIKMLLAKGADVNQANYIGETPLFMASQMDQLVIVKTLLANGANANQTNKAGETPLIIAAPNNFSEIIDALIAYGAEVNTANHDGETPLFLAALNSHLKLVKMLLKHGARVNQARKDGMTPLFIAVVMEDIEIINVLLYSGADCLQARKDGNTPLNKAWQLGCENIVNVLLSTNKTIINHFNLLIQLCCDKEIIKEKEIMIEKLVRRYAFFLFSITNNKNQTIYDVAKENNNTAFFNAINKISTKILNYCIERSYYKKQIANPLILTCLCNALLHKTHHDFKTFKELKKEIMKQQISLSNFDMTRLKAQPLLETEQDIKNQLITFYSDTILKRKANNERISIFNKKRKLSVNEDNLSVEKRIKKGP